MVAIVTSPIWLGIGKDPVAGSLNVIPEPFPTRVALDTSSSREYRQISNWVAGSEEAASSTANELTRQAMKKPVGILSMQFELRMEMPQ